MPCTPYLNKSHKLSGWPTDLLGSCRNNDNHEIYILTFGVNCSTSMSGQSSRWAEPIFYLDILGEKPKCHSYCLFIFVPVTES